MLISTSPAAPSRLDEAFGPRNGMVVDIKDTVAGVAGAICCTGFGSPFDVAKARLQSQAAHAKYTGLADCLYKTASSEGVRGLYRGVFPALSSAVAENSVGITVQRMLRRQLGVLQGTCGDVRHSAPTEVALGAATGVFTSIAICPFEVLKIRLQLQHSSGSGAAGLLSVTRDLLRVDGVGGLYRGLGAVICRDVPFNALFYGAYESLCTLLMRWKQLEKKSDLGRNARTPQSTVFVYIFLAGGLAGCTGWSCILPLDVVKTRQQAGSAVGPMASVFKDIVVVEGWRALFKGWSAAVCRAFPANAGLFLGVEVTSRWMARWCE